MSIMIGGLIVEINEVIGRIWTILVAPLMIILALFLGQPYSPDLLSTVFPVLHIIGFSPLIALGIIFSSILSKYDMIWRTIAYGWIASAYVIVGDFLSLIINPNIGFGLLCDTIVSDLGMVISLYLIFSGLIMFIDNYYSGKIEAHFISYPLIIAISVSIFLYLMPLFLYMMGYYPIPVTALEHRSDLVMDFIGWFITFILAFELFTRLKRSIFPEIVSICLISIVIATAYFYIDFIDVYYQSSFFASLLINSQAFILALVSMLITILFIHNAKIFLMPIYRSINREIGEAKSILIEYGLLDPYRTRTLLLLAMNRLLRGIRDADVMIYIAYIGSPHIDIMRSLALFNRLKFITVYILRGIGYPRYDSTYKAYITTLDPNLLRLVYEKVSGKRAIIVLDNISHFTILYGIDKVYTILSEFTKFIKERDLLIILMNREMHDRKELAYARNLTTNIIGLP